MTLHHISYSNPNLSAAYSHFLTLPAVISETGIRLFELWTLSTPEEVTTRCRFDSLMHR